MSNKFTFDNIEFDGEQLLIALVNLRNILHGGGDFRPMSSQMSYELSKFCQSMLEGKTFAEARSMHGQHL